MRPVVLASLVAALLAPAAAAQCVVDQEQAAHDSGTSARTLPGYTVWQSFTPSADGTLCGVAMGFFTPMTGEGRLDVLEGDGTGGAILASAVVPVTCGSAGLTLDEWDVDVLVAGGSRYTIRLTPDAATLPDPYGVAAAAGDPYPPGTMGLDDPSGSYEMPFDMVFRTRMGATAPRIAIHRSARPEDADDPASVIALVDASPFDDAAPPSLPLTCWIADDGAGGPALIRLARAGPDGIRITWN